MFVIILRDLLIKSSAIISRGISAIVVLGYGLPLNVKRIKKE